MARRVLMLGWEFPPFITGGLGTACYGLTKALDRQGLEVTFVLPKTIPADGASHVRLVTPGATIERKTARLPMPVAPTPAPAVVREPVRSAPEPVAANAPVTEREHETWNRIVAEFQSTRFIEIPGEYPSVYAESSGNSPARIAEAVRMMREAGWSI